MYNKFVVCILRDFAMSKKSAPKTLSNEKIESDPNDLAVKNQNDQSFSFVTKRPVRISNASTLILDSPIKSEIPSSLSSFSMPSSSPSFRRGSAFWSSPERFDDDGYHHPLKGIIFKIKSTMKMVQPRTPEFNPPMIVDDQFVTRRIRISEAPTLVLSELSSDSSTSPPPSPIRQSSVVSEPLLSMKYQQKIWTDENQKFHETVEVLPKGDTSTNVKVTDKSAKIPFKQLTVTMNDQQKQENGIKKFEKIITSTPKKEIVKNDQSYEHIIIEFDETRRREDDVARPPPPLVVASNPSTSDDGSLRYSSYAPGRNINSKTNLDESKSRPLMANESESTKLLPSLVDIDDWNDRQNLHTLSSFETTSHTKMIRTKHLKSGGLSWRYPSYDETGIIDSKTNILDSNKFETKKLPLIEDKKIDKYPQKSSVKIEISKRTPESNESSKSIDSIQISSVSDRPASLVGTRSDRQSQSKTSSIARIQQRRSRTRSKKFRGPLVARLSRPNRQLRRFIHRMFHSIINTHDDGNQPKMMISSDSIEILNSMAKEIIRKYAEYADQLILYSGRQKMDRWVSFSTLNMLLAPISHRTKRSIFNIIGEHGYYHDQSEIKIMRQ